MDSSRGAGRPAWSLGPGAAVPGGPRVFRQACPCPETRPFSQREFPGCNSSPREKEPAETGRVWVHPRHGHCRQGTVDSKAVHGAEPGQRTRTPAAGVHGPFVGASGSGTDKDRWGAAGEARAEGSRCGQLTTWQRGKAFRSFFLLFKSHTNYRARFHSVTVH